MDEEQGEHWRPLRPIKPVHTIAAAGTSVAAFIGWTPEGPMGEPVQVQSLAAYQETFGATTPDALLGYAVCMFFANGGSEAYIVRLADPNAGSAAGETLLPNSAAFEAALTGTSGYAALGGVAFHLLCVPGESTAAVVGELQAFCVTMGAFLIVDAAPTANASGLASTGPADAAGVSLVAEGAENSAFYFPWVLVESPVAGDSPVAFPPSGFVAGIFAAMDASQGVWKAPAGTGVVLSGVSGLQVTVTDAQSDALNGMGVNCLRQFPGEGIAVWGARTIAGSDVAYSEWKYIAVRRMALWIEASVRAGTQWTAFESSDASLWAQLRVDVGAFMQDVFAQGALAGATSEQAYFVQCDAENNPAANSAAGVVNITVGFAPSAPAEFVILQIQQMVAA